MKKTLTTILLIYLSTTLFAQKNPNESARPIVEEGKKLYQSEMASWYGTDLFLEKYPNRENIGGYFSYPTERNAATCIFFSKAEEPQVIGTIAFDSTFSTETAQLSLEERSFSNLEQEIFGIRQSALTRLQADTLVKMYNNTNLNIIPIIHEGEKKVYVLTGPEVSGVVIFGNDYLVTFDENNQVKELKNLHKNIIPISHGADSLETVATMHSHLPETGDYITATDICTLMLYSKFAKWKTHNVVTPKYLNIWDCTKNELLVMTMDAIEKINKDQKKRKKKKKN
ncbi:MAG: hypothetical protein KDE26_09510 [Bacteroidetes bacterium]|nr:hypothetical protein [Bacteroidota bacterium]